MTTTTQIAPVRRTIRVRATPERAFRFFTGEMSRWWPTNFSIGTAPMQSAHIEPRVGGRWYEVGTDGSQCQWGEVLAWNPPHAVTLAWRIGANWQFDPDLLTEVEVRFRAVGGAETEVTLEHRKLENYGGSASELLGIFTSPGGWSAALARFAENIDA